MHANFTEDIAEALLKTSTDTRRLTASSDTSDVDLRNAGGLPRVFRPLMSIVLGWVSPRGMFVHQGAQETNYLAICQFSFPVTCNGFATLYKSLSIWTEALKT